MKPEKIKALERHFFEELGKGKAAAMAVIDETCHANVVYQGSVGEDAIGLMDLKKFYSAVFDAFPDSQITLDDIIVEGHKAAVRYSATGTHKGVFMGIPPTNKKIKVWKIEIHNIVDGKFVEVWARSDSIGMMQQLGIVPMPRMQK